MSALTVFCIVCYSDNICKAPGLDPPVWRHSLRKWNESVTSPCFITGVLLLQRRASRKDAHPKHVLFQVFLLFMMWAATSANDEKIPHSMDLRAFAVLDTSCISYFSVRCLTYSRWCSNPVWAGPLLRHLPELLLATGWWCLQLTNITQTSSIRYIIINTLQKHKTATLQFQTSSLKPFQFKEATKELLMGKERCTLQAFSCQPLGVHALRAPCVQSTILVAWQSLTKDSRVQRCQVVGN